MVSEMSIIKADISDIKIVKYITTETINSIYPCYYPEGAVDFFLGHHNDKNIENDIKSGIVYLCFDDKNNVIGTVTIKENEICRLFVLPEYQGNGYGRELISFAEDEIFQKYDMRISSVDGGLKNNAIVSSASSEIVSHGNPEDVIKYMEDVFNDEYAACENHITVSLRKCSQKYVPMTFESTEKIITALMCYPDSIQSMSFEIENLVKTSLNLGILKTTEESVLAEFCVRSSVFTEKQMIVNRLMLLTKTLGGVCVTEGDYPPWEYLRVLSFLLEIIIHFQTAKASG